MEQEAISVTGSHSLLTKMVKCKEENDRLKRQENDS